MNSLPIQRYIFSWHAKSKLSFPLYSGSILRGHFGNQLRKTVCFTKRDKCTGCSLVNRCSYGRLYETISSNANKIPHPYIIEPLKYGTQIIASDEVFSFSMVLIGKDVVDDLPLIIFVWEQVFNRGFKHRENIGYAELISVSLTDGTIVYDNNASSDDHVVVPHPMCNERSKQFIFKNNQINIELQTPLRLQGLDPVNNKQVIVGKHLFDARCFIQAILRRCKIVLNQQLQYAATIPNWEQFMDVKISRQKLFWTCTKRFSSSQNQEMDFYGLIGSFELVGESLEQLYHWLLLGEILHIGKSSTFGFGMYTIKE